MSKRTDMPATAPKSSSKRKGANKETGQEKEKKKKKRRRVQRLKDLDGLVVERDGFVRLNGVTVGR